MAPHILISSNGACITCQFTYPSSMLVLIAYHLASPTARRNTCAYCWEKYERMGHGLSDITLDVIDREREPYYRTNTRWCCQTCNREKASLPPWLWERRLIVWPLYMRWREGVLASPTHGLPLFANRALLMLTGLALGSLITWLI
jgi:hypothetical protein